MRWPTLPHLQSARLTIRPVCAVDLPDLLRINGDAQVTQFLPYPTWTCLDDGVAWLARMEALTAAGTGLQLVIEQQHEAQVIGTVLLFRYDEGSRRLEIGYVLARRCWGLGLMREALVCVCGHAFDVLGLRRIEAEVNPDNIASARVLASLGFVLEGRLRQRWQAKGRVYDTQFYGCLADDLRRLPTAG
jgi:[ribosomal protein S5]-alanine N-acetyltransferase